jgi:amino acid permease
MNRKGVVFVFVYLVVISPVANCYVGPGAGLTIIGSFLALLLAIIITLVGFIWFPLKRLLKKEQQSTEDAEEENESIGNE